ncbi:hypothetical protein ACFHYQ_09660 [Sphaerimonospora cavernae]|uniref:XRE family transcriptional regulator n=1 Tax=Sphaerimonospora cavernae TaxID=1740611 RepID=A0ABV6U2A0_9ACTN
MAERRAWSDKRAEIMSRPGAGAVYEAARIRFELGEAVRRRREELGLTQAKHADGRSLPSSAVRSSLWNVSRPRDVRRRNQQ